MPSPRRHNKHRKRIAPTALSNLPPSDRHNNDGKQHHASSLFTNQNEGAKLHCPMKNVSSKKMGPVIAFDECSSDSDNDTDHFPPARRTLHMASVSVAVAASSSASVMSPSFSSRSKDKEAANKGDTASAVSNGTADDEIEVIDDSDENEISGDDDDDEEEDESDLPPTARELSCLCWKCHVTLKIPQSPTRTSTQKFCYYALHVHPTLQVPMCSVCTAEVAKHYEKYYSENGSNCSGSLSSMTDVCHACVADGDSDATLLLCDDCQVAFCTTCVAQAYGGGRKGSKAVKSFLAEDDSVPWSCIVCTPPQPLKDLQEELNQTALSQDNNCEDTSTTTRQRTLEDILLELDLVETEKERFQQQFDDPAKLESKRREIESEIRQSKPKLSQAKLASLVEDEMEKWKDLCIKHDQRLGDMASSLQEELEVVHSLDLAKVYKNCFGKRDKPEDEGEPDWKRAADEEITKRKEEEAKKPVDPNFSDSVYPKHVYEKEIYDDVEDLMTKPEDNRDCPGEGFRHSGLRPSQQQIQEAIQSEDALLAEKKVFIARHYDNDMDVQETVAEEKLTSLQGFGGVSRVRRDTFLTQMKVRKRDKRPPKPAPRLDDEKPSEHLDEETRTAVATVAHAQIVAEEPKAVPKKPPPALKEDVVHVDLTGDSPVIKRQPKHSVSVASLKKPAPMEEKNAAPQSISSFTYGDEYYLPSEAEFANSDLVLSSPQTTRAASGRRVKTVTVSSDLAAHLKSHQREGVKFMWNNAFVDLNVRTSLEEEVYEDKEVGGCLLAHSMGLGKSFSVIALLHTLFYNPVLRDHDGKRFVRTAMLVVPVNTIASWKNEFSKWTKRVMMIYDIMACNNVSRSIVISQWLDKGGVLLISKDSFLRMAKEHTNLQSPGPDVLVLDEAHMMLSNKNSAIYKALAGIKTKRRILLTGTPFQNNTMEYYHMIRYIRPDVLSQSESSFQRDFADPIMKGMPSDAEPCAVTECQLKSTQLKNILNPYVHRKDTTVLRKTLPPLQQVVLHLRQTKLQTNLYKSLARFEKENGVTSYLNRYQFARPIHNHPACLVMQSPPGASSDSDEEDTSTTALFQRWKQTRIDKVGVKSMKAVDKGYKIVVLLHILCHSVEIGDKVVVFSQCLKTLDFVEKVLQSKQWTNRVSSLREAFPASNLGRWTKGTEYLRIDGDIDSGKRGDLITQFNKVEERVEERVQLFLISSKAGGVGITLTAANRVVLLDTHFNPTVMSQALARCYRYGQMKPVFVYRFLTEGTSEEKIYSRSVNKTGVSMRVVDGKNFKTSFTENELSNLVLNDTWVQCDRCEKWRMLRQVEDDQDLPDKWYCHMNVHDPVNNTCDASEKDVRWYHMHFQLTAINVEDLDGGKTSQTEQYTENPSKNSEEYEQTNMACSDPQKEMLVSKDEILTKLLDPETSASSMISKYYFHEALFEDPDKDNGSDSETTEERKHTDNDREWTGNADSKVAALPKKAMATSDSDKSHCSEIHAKKIALVDAMPKYSEKNSPPRPRTDAKQSFDIRSPRGQRTDKSVASRKRQKECDDDESSKYFTVFAKKARTEGHHHTSPGRNSACRISAGGDGISGSAARAERPNKQCSSDHRKPPPSNGRKRRHKKKSKKRKQSEIIELLSSDSDSG